MYFLLILFIRIKHIMNKYFLNFYEFCGQSKRFRIQKTLFSFYFPSILNIMFGLFMAIVYRKMLVYICMMILNIKEG